jgi:FtsH-binding integral membrane protein
MNKTTHSKLGTWPLFFIQIIIIFVLALIPMPPFIKFLIFCVFSYTIGLMLSKLKNYYDPQLIDLAIKGALSIYGVMLAVGLVLVGTGIQLGYKFGAFLLLALLALIIIRLVNMLGGVSIAKKTLSYIGLVLFSIFVIYDTTEILNREYYGDFITASLDYYLDIKVGDEVHR